MTSKRARHEVEALEGGSKPSKQGETSSLQQELLSDPLGDRYSKAFTLEVIKDLRTADTAPSLGEVCARNPAAPVIFQTPSEEFWGERIHQRWACTPQGSVGCANVDRCLGIHRGFSLLHSCIQALEVWKKHHWGISSRTRVPYCSDTPQVLICGMHKHTHCVHCLLGPYEDLHFCACPRVQALRWCAHGSRKNEGSFWQWFSACL